MRRSGLPLVLSLLVLIPSSATATATATAAPVTFSYSVSTHSLRYHGAGTKASIKLRTGSSAQTVSLGLQPSRWQDRDMLGSPLQTFDQRVTGAGRITGTFASSCCDVAAGVSICRRGGSPDTGNGIDLALPADSTTTVSYRVRLAAPPWPAPIYLGVAVGVPATAQDSSQISYYHLGPEQFTIRGRTGVQIHLAAIAGARREGNASYPVVAAGDTITIAGTTNPKVAGARLQIGYAATTSRRQGAVGTVTTDRRGAFRIAWKPPASGTYTITSAYTHPAAGLLADHNCDLALLVR
jgi:hypothetical protein